MKELTLLELKVLHGALDILMHAKPIDLACVLSTKKRRRPQPELLSLFNKVDDALAEASLDASYEEGDSPCP